MNRRGFFKTLATAMAGFTILPPATTYERVWKATKASPRWMTMRYEVSSQLFTPTAYAGEWRWLADESQAQLDFKTTEEPPIRYQLIDGLFQRVDTFTSA